jgi:hypothetical protein
MFKTLALLTDLHIITQQWQQAHTSIKDLESLQLSQTDADTYILKVRILMNE